MKILNRLYAKFSTGNAFAAFWTIYLLVVVSISYAISDSTIWNQERVYRIGNSGSEKERRHVLMVERGRP